MVGVTARERAGGGNADYMRQRVREDYMLETYIYGPSTFTGAGDDSIALGDYRWWSMFMNSPRQICGKAVKGSLTR